MSAKLIRIIRTEHHTGKGTQSDPCRRVVGYYLPSGELLTEEDPARPHQLQARDDVEAIAQILDCHPSEVVPRVAQLERLLRERSEAASPWCEPCRSFHPEPRDESHKQALRCRA